jgi:hypothetical protein
VKKHTKTGGKYKRFEVVYRKTDRFVNAQQFQKNQENQDVLPAGGDFA